MVGRLRQMRSLMQNIDWEALRRDVEEEAQGRLTIIGPINAGKSTLFNTLIGQSVAPVSPDPSTTRAIDRAMWGALLLADTPAIGQLDDPDAADVVAKAIQQANALILTFDAAGGRREKDAVLLRRILEFDVPVVVALNKIDLVPKNQRASLISHAQQTFEPTRVAAISSRDGEGISENLLPAILAAAPTLAIPIGRTLPAYRQRTAQSAIRTAALATSLVGLEPIPLADIPLLLTVQARMILRIAAIYGETTSANHAKELLTTMVGGMGLRYMAQQAAKILPGPGWLISGGIAAAGTWTIGQVAVRYFEDGQRLSGGELRQLYKQLLQRAPKSLRPSQ